MSLGIFNIKKGHQLEVEDPCGMTVGRIKECVNARALLNPRYKRGLVRLRNSPFQGGRFDALAIGSGGCFLALKMLIDLVNPRYKRGLVRKEKALHINQEVMSLDICAIKKIID